MTVSKKRMKQVDRVRWRLLPERDRDNLVQITLVRNQKISTVLRLLASRYNSNVDSYWRAVCQPNGAASALPRAPRPISAAKLAKMLGQFTVGEP